VIIVGLHILAFHPHLAILDPGTRRFSRGASACDVVLDRVKRVAVCSAFGEKTL
jgi:hypothetical protein